MRFNVTSSEVIPIRYMVGTGGVFLASLLTAAKNNEKISMRLSPHGNCHNRSHDFFSIVHPSAGLGPNSPDHLKVSALHSIHAAVGDAPYFVHSHIKDLDLALKNFPKVITICYHPEDLDILGTLIVHKFGIDVYGRFDLETVQSRWSEFLIDAMAQFNQEAPGNFKVQFKDLLFSDTHILLSRLSEITGFPTENFDVDFINEWRIASLANVPMPKLPIVGVLVKHSFNEAGDKQLEIVRYGEGYKDNVPSSKSWRDVQKAAFKNGENREIAQDQYLIDLAKKFDPSTIYGHGDVGYFRKFFSFAEGEPQGDFDFIFVIVNGEVSVPNLKLQLQNLSSNLNLFGQMYVAVNKHCVIRYNAQDAKSPIDDYDLALQDLMVSSTGFSVLDSGFNPKDNGRFFNFVHPTSYVLLQNNG